MKNKNIRSKTSIVSMAAALLVAPITVAQSYEQDTAEPSIHEQMEASDLKVEINSISVATEQLRGAEVINLDDKRLGEIEDVVYTGQNQDVTHLIVSTDNWFDGNSALIPIGEISFKDSPDEGDVGEQALDWIRGTSVVLDMSEDHFDEIATFERGQELAQYLKENGEDIAQALDIDAAEFYNDDSEYFSHYVNRSARDDSRMDTPVNAYSNYDAAQEARYRAANEGDPEWEDRELQIDGKTVKASEIRGTVVVNTTDERLGKVVDIAINDEDSDKQFLVVRTDNWFDGDLAIVPLESISYQADSDETMSGDTLNWWSGDHIVLDMAEERFDSVADYKRTYDLSSYMDERRDQMSEDYQMRSSQIPYAGSYSFVYSYPVTPYMYSEREQRGYEKSRSDVFTPARDENVEIGDKSVEARELRGAEVKNSADEQIASVEDIVFESNSQEPRFLVLQRQSDDLMTVVPVSTIEYDTETATGSMDSGSNAKWDGEQIVLNADTEEFNNWVTFSSSNDFGQYLESNADKLSKAFNIDESEVFDSEDEFVFTFDKGGYRTASR